MFTWKTMLYCILSISAGITFFSQVDLQAYSIKDSSQTIVKKKRIYSPVQTITGDTLQIDSVKKIYKSFLALQVNTQQIKIQHIIECYV